MAIDRFLPTAPGQVKYAFALLGAGLVVLQVIKEYKRYKNGLVAR
jgi:hypothetical protein